MRVQVKSNFLALSDSEPEPSLTAGNEYVVIRISQENYRVIDDRGDLALLPKHLFLVVDASIPAGWQFRAYEDGWYVVEPERLSRPHFYDDVVGRRGAAAQRTAWLAVQQVLSGMSADASASERALIESALVRVAARTPPLSGAS